MNLRTNRTKRILAVSLVGLFGGLLLVPASASGAPIDDKRAEAARLQAAINENGAKTDILSEQINGAQYALEQAEAKIADAKARTKVARAESERLEGLLTDRAVEIYTSAGNTSPLDAVDVANVNEIAARAKYAAAASSLDRRSRPPATSASNLPAASAARAAVCSGAGPP